MPCLVAPLVHGDNLYPKLNKTLNAAHVVMPLRRTCGLALQRRLERLRPRHPPSITEACVFGTFEQLARTQRGIELREGFHVRRRGTLGEVDRAQLLRMFETGRGDQLGQRVQRRKVIIVHAVNLERHIERARPRRVLGRDAGRAAVVVAAQRLDAAEREHEAARRITVVRADRHGPRHVEGGGDLARGADLDAVARVDADQGVVDETDALAHRHAQMVHELQRRGAGAALVAVDDDEVGIDAGLDHRLADRQKFPGMADAQLEAGRLAAGELSHLADELHHANRRREGAMRGRRDAILAHRDAADLGNLLRDFRRRQHAAVTGLGTLADLELDHLDLVLARDAREGFGIEGAVEMAAAEIDLTYLPDDGAALLRVIGAEAALAGVVRETALPGAGIQRAHGVRAERAKTHRGNVEHRSRIRLGATRPADGDAEFLLGMRLRRDRVMHPLITLAVDVLLGAERTLVELHLGALIDHRTDVARERHAVLLALEEVLPHLRAYLFEQKTDMGRDRVVAQNGVALLHEVADAKRRQRAEDQDRDQQDVEDFAVGEPDAGQQRRDNRADRQDDEARGEWQQQGFHDPLFRQR